jgi:hypothetical protein
VKEIGADYLLTEEKGLIDFLRIDLRMFDQTQPFLLRLEDGLIHSMRILPPIAEKSNLPEFSIMGFQLVENSSSSV